MAELIAELNASPEGECSATPCFVNNTQRNMADCLSVSALLLSSSKPYSWKSKKIHPGASSPIKSVVLLVLYTVTYAGTPPLMAIGLLLRCAQTRGYLPSPIYPLTNKQRLLWVRVVMTSDVSPSPIRAETLFSHIPLFGHKWQAEGL